MSNSEGQNLQSSGEDTEVVNGVVPSKAAKVKAGPNNRSRVAKVKGRGVAKSGRRGAPRGRGSDQPSQSTSKVSPNATQEIKNDDDDDEPKGDGDGETGDKPVVNSESPPDMMDLTGPSSIKIKVVNTSSHEVYFRIRMNTTLDKVKKAYAERMGLKVRTLRYLFDGSRVNDKDTPSKLKMENDSVIEVYQEQTAGSFWKLS